GGGPAALLLARQLVAVDHEGPETERRRVLPTPGTGKLAERGLHRVVAGRRERAAAVDRRQPAKGAQIEILLIAPGEVDRDLHEGHGPLARQPPGDLGRVAHARRLVLMQRSGTQLGTRWPQR